MCLFYLLRLLKSYDKLACSLPVVASISTFFWDLRWLWGGCYAENGPGLSAVEAKSCESHV